MIKVDQSSSGKQEDNNSQQNKMIKPKNIKGYIQSRPECLEYHIHILDVPQQNMS